MGSPVGVMPAGQSNNPIISVYPITFFNGKVNIVWRSNLFVQGLFVWAYMLVNNENLSKSNVPWPSEIFTPVVMPVYPCSYFLTF